MAFGGVQINRTSNSGDPFKNFITIEGLTLEPFLGPPFDRTNPAVGEFTTSQTPAVGQNVIPSYFGRGPGNWRSDDAFTLIFSFQLIFDPVQVDIAVPFHLGTNSPRVVNGELEITFFNIINNGGGSTALPVRFSILFPHSLIR
jgi:hypothetical protein